MLFFVLRHLGTQYANAHVYAPNYAGVSFASFAKGMTAYFGRLEAFCYKKSTQAHILLPFDPSYSLN